MKDVHIRDYAMNDPVAFLQQTTDGMFIDEVQKAPVLMEYIQGIVDRHPERRFLLTGSSNFEMMRDLSESLAGRAGVFELMPMSLSETVAQRTDRDLSQQIFEGLYPAVIAGKSLITKTSPKGWSKVLNCTSTTRDWHVICWI